MEYKIYVVRFADGSYYCQGNCAHCHYNEEGCFKLKENESVIFPAH